MRLKDDLPYTKSMMISIEININLTGNLTDDTSDSNEDCFSLCRMKTIFVSESSLTHLKHLEDIIYCD